MKDWNKWKAIGKKLLFPPVWIMALLTIFSTAALILIFLKGWEMSLPAYPCYVLAFYTLSVDVVFGWKVLPGYYRRVNSKVRGYTYVDRYFTDVEFKTKVGLYRSLAINFVYVGMNAISGIVYKTHWFAIFAVYYGIIAIMRFLLVRYMMKHAIGENRLGELKRARLCAWILLTVNLALSGAVLMMILFDRGFQYQGILIYAIAAYTFYVTVSAIIDMIKYRKYKSPIMSVTKGIKMASALFSMLFLETAMFAQFGADTSPFVKQIMIILTGAGICVTVVSIALYMIVQTTKEIKQFKQEQVVRG